VKEVKVTGNKVLPADTVPMPATGVLQAGITVIDTA